MSEPRDRDVHKAFLSALNESGKRYLLVGDLASAVNEVLGPTRKAEAWVEPSTTRHEATDIRIRTHELLKAQFGEVDPYLIRDKVQIHHKAPGLDFERAYAQRRESTIAGQPTAAVCAEDDVAHKLASGSKEDLEKARQVLMLHRSQQTAGPNHGPGPSLDNGPEPDNHRGPKL